MSIDLSLVSPKLEQQQIIQYLQQSLNSNSVTVLPEILYCTQSTTSTNDDAKHLFEQGFSRAIALTQQQTHGRGQRQNQWLSLLGNIFISFLMPLNRAIDGRLSLECGLHILQCPTLKTLYDNDKLKIKWANDLYSSQGKWAGISIDPLQRNGQHFVIIGVGINVIPMPMNDEKINHQIQQRFTSLIDLGLNHYHRQQFIAELYIAISQAIMMFNQSCPNLSARFNANAMFINEKMHIQRPNQESIAGIYHGIQADGALLLQCDNQPHDTAFYDARLIVPHQI